MVFVDFKSATTKKTYYAELTTKVKAGEVFNALTAVAKQFIPAFLKAYGDTTSLANTKKFSVYYAKSGKIYNDVTVTLNEDGTYEIAENEWFTHPTVFTWTFDSKLFTENDLPTD